ncbi:MAG: hypothetical protein HW408_1229 [Actinobacteria bacterium]|nr:hypothetical protein [Actinomycetota bacterium]
MPWVDFECPDGGKIQIEKCLVSCRMGARCVAKPTLMLMSKRREWKGKISATQGLNGTRMEYLKITQPFSERPTDRAFALLGTFHHLKMQGVAVPESLTEEWMEDEAGTGMFDCYDAEEKALYDFKTCGCYKINKALGKVKEENEVIIPDGEDGSGFYKSGARKGMAKTRKVITWSLGDPDIFEWQMQLSRYAWMIKDAGFEVERAYVQATARDFNQQNARQYGLDRQIYIIPVEILAREVVVPFYLAKQEALLYALANKETPPPCAPKETWDGRRCAGYCPVWQYCDVGIAAHQKAPEPEKEEVV